MSCPITCTAGCNHIALCVIAVRTCMHHHPPYINCRACRCSFSCLVCNPPVSCIWPKLRRIIQSCSFPSQLSRLQHVFSARITFTMSHASRHRLSCAIDTNSISNYTATITHVFGTVPSRTNTMNTAARRQVCASSCPSRWHI